MSATIAVETLVVSHPNADFDAFAGMLAAQLLYPGGSHLPARRRENRDLHGFYNLHAERDPRRGAVRPRSRQRTAARAPWRWPTRSASVSWPSWPGMTASRWWRSTITPIGPSPQRGLRPLWPPDGSVVTGMLRLLLERGARISPMHATAFALGIHEDTGSLDVLIDHPPRRRGAGRVRAPRGEPGAARPLPAQPAAA